MKSWFWPDGFVGADPTSKRNARWLGFFIALYLVFALGMCSAFAATNVWMFYGWGDNAFGSSSGIDQLARQIRTLKGVGTVTVFNYWQTQVASDQARAASASDKKVFIGYSCGGNAVLAMQTAGYSYYGITIQPSLWCGRYPLSSNMVYYQETYGPCLLTLGFGCYHPSGPAQKAVFIERPDLHPQADTDPNTQRDVVGAVYAIANGRMGPMARHLHSTTHLRRYNGQDVYHFQER